MLVNREIVMEDHCGEPTPTAVFDLSEQQASAAFDALRFYHRHHYGGASLDADDILAMYALGSVVDQFASIAARGGHATMRLPHTGVHAFSEAVGHYIAERDVDSYQSPEERHRIALLRPLLEPLMDLVADLHAAERQADVMVA